ncbi:MAG: hypothetical protein PHD73_11900 [Sediminibacterium sp.]|nr:hypothetical protein [Sediminibacterium sp.]
MSVRLIDRLYQYLSEKGISAYAFEHTCGLSNGYLGKQYKGKGSVGSAVLEKIRLCYPDLDIYWLVTGEGAMSSLNMELISAYQKQIKQLEWLVADKDSIIELLQQSLQDAAVR